MAGYTKKKQFYIQMYARRIKPIKSNIYLPTITRKEIIKMTYGIKVTPEQTKILDDNNICYDFYDIDDITSNNDTAEIEIDEWDYEKVCQLLNLK